jgi:hypothetical protein
MKDKKRFNSTQLLPFNLFSIKKRFNAIFNKILSYFIPEANETIRTQIIEFSFGIVVRKPIHLYFVEHFENIK